MLHGLRTLRLWVSGITRAKGDLLCDQWYLPTALLIVRPEMYLGSQESRPNGDDIDQ